MLKRKIMQNLIDWKNKNKKKVLIIEGARQVGKTYIINKFGTENYTNFIKIDFFEHPEYISIFDGALTGENIEIQIKLRVPGGEKIEPGKTLIFLDEIQRCPNAITALKYLTIDGRYDVIASGSLLGLNYKKVISYPVGYVEHIEMYSLDFEEFLWANGVSESSIKALKEYFDNRKPIPIAIHETMLEHFKNYIVIGGMPEAVQEFIDSKNYKFVLQIQKDILKQYRDDIQLYADDNEKPKIKACFDSIPKHLAQDYKKFRYNLVEKNGRASKFGGSLQWLFDAGITNFCYNLKTLELPLEGYSIESVFKVYMRDTGLLIAMLDDPDAQIDIIDGNLGIYKGALYENVIADLLGKKGYSLYYFEYNSTLELDFIIKYNHEIVALEVKSGDNTKSKSLNSAIDNWKIKYGIRLSTKNIGESSTNIITLPLYMILFL